MTRYGWVDDWLIDSRRTEDEAGESLKGLALVEHEPLEVADEEVEVLDVALEPAREPVAPVVLPEHWGLVWGDGGREEGEGDDTSHNTPESFYAHSLHMPSSS